MGLLGQLAICPQDLQNVTDIIHHNLEFYTSEFGGWSGLVRKTAEKYSLPDPGQYMLSPWRPDRWRSYCRGVIAQKWEDDLKQKAVPLLTRYRITVSYEARQNLVHGWTRI